jgi:hypothetical protein
VDDGAHAFEVLFDEIPIADRAHAIGEGRRLDVDAARRPTLGTKTPHQRFAEVTGASGYKDCHGRSAPHDRVPSRRRMNGLPIQSITIAG